MDHSLGSAGYIELISDSYFWFIILRFIFNVGVNSPESTPNQVVSILYFCTFWALDMAFLLATSSPSSIIFCTALHAIASATVVALDPLALIYPTTSSAKTPGALVLSNSRQLRYFLLSPITTTFEKRGRAVLIWFYNKTGGMFSPPAVIMSYFIRPVIDSTPFSFSMPTSPECTNPLGSIVSLVYFSFLQYPINTFLPLRHIYPLPSVSGLLMNVCRPGRVIPDYLSEGMEWKSFRV